MLMRRSIYLAELPQTGDGAGGLLELVTERTLLCGRANEFGKLAVLWRKGRKEGPIEQN